MKRILRGESGDIIILFSGVFLLLLVIVGFATDVILAFNKRDRLVEVGHAMREARLDRAQELMSSDYPEDLFREISLDIARRNGLDDSQVKTYWTGGRVQTNTVRTVDARIELTDTYECTVLKMVGLKELPIKVVIDGFLNNRRSPYVWRPGMW